MTQHTSRKEMKEDAQLWHNLLWCSGGKLELSKCRYHVIHYNFEYSGIPIMIHSPGAGESIMLKNEHGENIPIKSKNIFQRRVNLGHAKSPADSCKTEFERTMKKSVNIGNVVAQCNGTRSESRMLYKPVWKSAVEYITTIIFIGKTSSNN
jgi:hypothetical protein